MNIAAKKANVAGIQSQHDQACTFSASLCQPPAIRQERIAKLKRRIQQGTFCPTSDKIAEAMLAEGDIALISFRLASDYADF